MCQLFESEDPGSMEAMQEMHNELVAYYKEHNLTEMWISDDENDSNETKAPVSKKLHHDYGKGLT
ncbi:unnamed protein product [Gongylonema pulchrum]|nr:unnamed protein product [Gongylonema pulchrum]